MRITGKILKLIENVNSDEILTVGNNGIQGKTITELGLNSGLSNNNYMKLQENVSENGA